jgi:hypothetical protein
VKNTGSGSNLISFPFVCFYYFHYFKPVLQRVDITLAGGVIRLGISDPDQTTLILPLMVLLSRSAPQDYKQIWVPLLGLDCVLFYPPPPVV